MRKKIITYITVLSLLLSCIAFTGCNNNIDDGTTVIRLNEVTHSIFYAPQYAAIQLGYFQEAGIEIELYNGGGADKSMTAILSGQADIGLMGSEAAIYVYNEGKEDYPKIIGQLTQRDGSFLVGRNPDSNFQWESLRGKTIIGGRSGGMPLMIFEYILRKNGITPNVDAEVLTNVQFDVMAGAFEGGTADYVNLFEPTASAAQEAGVGYVLASLGEASGYIPYTVYMVSQTYAKENPEVVERFLAVIYKAQQWVNTHSAQEIADVISPSFGGTSAETIVSALQRYKDIDAWKTTPHLEEGSFDAFQEIMTDAGELEAKVPFHQIVDNSYADKVTK